MEGRIATAVEITRRSCRLRNGGCKDGRKGDTKASRPMLALGVVLDGQGRAEAAQSCGMHRQTLRERGRRYHSEGRAGLLDRPLPGAGRSSTRVDERVGEHFGGRTAGPPACLVEAPNT